MSIKEEVTNTPLYTSLYGLKHVFEQEFGISDIFFMFTEDQKAFLKRKNHTHYPYAFFKISSLRVLKDQANLKTLQKHGRLAVSSWSNATVSKNYMFPVSLSLEFQYKNSSLQETLHFVEHFVLLAATEKLSYRIKYDSATEWVCRVSISEASVSFSEAQLSNTADPASLEISIPFELFTHIGFTRDVSRMQREHQMRLVTVGE